MFRCVLLCLAKPAHLEEEMIQSGATSPDCRVCRITAGLQAWEFKYPLMGAEASLETFIKSILQVLLK